MVGVEVNTNNIRRRIMKVEETRINSDEERERSVKDLSKSQGTQGNVWTLPLEREYNHGYGLCDSSQNIGP